MLLAVTQMTCQFEFEIVLIAYKRYLVPVYYLLQYLLERRVSRGANKAIQDAGIRIKGVP
jgi:hypothetical protein